jgi:hypothetical protein
MQTGGVDEPETDQRAATDSAVLTALGWSVLVTTVTLLSASGILTGGRDCGEQSWCLTSETILTIGVVAGAPLWLGYMLVSWLMTILYVRLVRSPFWAGTLAAASAAALILLVLTVSFGS